MKTARYTRVARAASRNLQSQKSEGEKQYRLGLVYCILGNANQAKHWFRLARENKHQKAVEVLDEIKIRNI